MLEITADIAEKMAKIVFTAKDKGEVLIQPLVEAYFSDLSSGDRLVISSKVEMRLKRIQEKS